MAHAAAGSNCCTGSLDCSGASSGLLRDDERLQRLLAALHTSLAEETLRALDADVRALITAMTWAQLADILRLTRSSAWRRGLLVPANAVPHQTLWLLAGGDAPSPQQLPGGRHRALVLALEAKIEKQFESNATAEDFRAKKRTNPNPNPGLDRQRGRRGRRGRCDGQRWGSVEGCLGRGLRRRGDGGWRRRGRRWRSFQR